MHLLPSSLLPIATGFASGLRGLLRPGGLRALFRSNPNQGRERYRRAGITASVSLIQRALTIVISIVSVPLTIGYLGPERYGVWLTISSLLVWMAMTDFGLAGNALVNVLSQADGRDDRKAAQEYTSSAVWALTAIAVLFAIVAIISFQFIPWTSVFRVSTMSMHELNVACALTLIFFIVALPLSVQNSIYSAYQDGFLSNICGIVMNLLSLVALVVVSRFHGGLPELVLALSGTRLAVALVNVHYMFFKRYRWLLPVPSAVRWHCIRRLFSLGGKYVLTQLGSFGMCQSQPMIITQVLGPTKVVAFVIAQKVITLPMDMVYMATVPLIPAFGEANARNDWKWIKEAYRNVTLGSVAIGIPILVGIALASRPMIRAWAGDAAVPSMDLIVWLSVYNLFGVSLMATGQFLIGIERVNSLTISIVLCAIGTIAFGIVACKWWGLSGVAMAMAITKVITYWPIQLWAVRRIFAARRMPPVNAASEAAA